jgi:hypothetical protein
MTGAPRRAGTGDRLVHDPPDGTDAPPALCAATKAAVDLAGARRIRRRHRCAHVTVTEHVAGADDHEKARHQPVGTMCNYLLNWGRRGKRKAHNLHVFQSGLPSAQKEFTASGHFVGRSNVIAAIPECGKLHREGWPRLRRRPGSARRRCRRPPPRSAPCRRPPPSLGSPARCRTGARSGGPGR